MIEMIDFSQVKRKPTGCGVVVGSWHLTPFSYKCPAYRTENAVRYIQTKVRIHDRNSGKSFKYTDF